MKQNYDYCLKEVLKSEGGYTNDAQDPGGPTNYGITIADYRMYVKRNATSKDVKNMSLDDAKKIYKTKYWDAVDGDTLSSGVDYAVFDYGVNSGVSRALRVYNQFKDKSSVDCINAVCDERIAFLRRLRTFSRFGKGWSDRVARVRHDSINLTKSVSPSAGVAVGAAAGGSYLATYFHDHWMLIVAGSVVGAVLLGAGIHYFRKRGK